MAALAVALLAPACPASAEGLSVAERERLAAGAVAADSVARRLEATAQALARRVEHLAATDPRRLGALVEGLHAMVTTR